MPVEAVLPDWRIKSTTAMRKVGCVGRGQWQHQPAAVWPCERSLFLVTLGDLNRFQKQPRLDLFSAVDGERLQALSQRRVVRPTL